MFRFEDGDAYEVEVCDYHQSAEGRMSIANTGIKRRPTHPGEMLREDFLPDYDLTVSGLAEVIGVSRQSVNELLRERRAVVRRWRSGYPDFSATVRSFGLNAQRAVDLSEAGKAIQGDMRRIRPLSAA